MKILSTPARKRLVIAALEDIMAHDIQAIDVHRLTSICDWIVVATADSARQTRALSRHVRDALRDAGVSIVGTEGEDAAEWILVDAGDVVVHVMQPAVREYYNLEELWSDGKFDKLVNSTVPAVEKRRPAKRPAVKRPAAKARRKPSSPRRG